MDDSLSRPATVDRPTNWQRYAGIAAPFLLLLLVIVYIQIASSAYIQRVLIVLGLDIMLVVGLNLFNGFTGVFSLGHTGFMAIGAYVSAILTLPLEKKVTNLPDLPLWLGHTQLGFFPAMLLGGLVATLVALLIGRPILRLSGHYVAVATLAFLVIVRVILINATPYTRGSRTFSGTPPYTTVWWVYAWVVVSIYVAWRVLRSPYGRAMLAQREDRAAARSVGVHVLRSRMWAFCISAFLTGVAGALWGHYILSFSPNAFYFSEAFDVITMLVVGGMGSISGSAIGAILVVVLSEFLRNMEGGFSLGIVQIPALYGMSQILMAVLFISILIFRREGLFGDREIDLTRLFVLDSWRALLKRKEV